MLITEPGIYDIADLDYHADVVCEQPSLSSSIAAVIVDQCLRVAWHRHPRLNPNFEPINRDAYDSGRARHAYFLGLEDQIQVIHGFDDWRKNAAKEEREAARKLGKVPVLEEKMDEIRRFSDAIRRDIRHHSEWPTAFTNGEPEKTLVWFEGEGEDRIACRAKLDWLPAGGNAFHDFKTTDATAGADWGRRTMFNIGADIQSAFYLRGIRKVLGIKEAHFIFLVAENAEPHCSMFHVLDPEAADAADTKVEYAISCWRWAMKHGAWPGYPHRTNWVEVPPWEKAKAQFLGTGPTEKPSKEELAAALAFQAPDAYR